MVQAGHFDQLVCEMLELLDQNAGRLNLKRKRIEGEASDIECKAPRSVFACQGCSSVQR